MVATPPPYKVVDNGAGVIIDGRRYATNDANSKAANALPDSTITTMARYMVNAVDKMKGGGGYTGASKEWMKGARGTLPGAPDQTYHSRILIDYAEAVALIQTGELGTAPLDPGTILPGSDNPITGPITGAITTFSSISDAITSLVSALFNPHFWLRVLEVGIGAILLGVGLSHLTDLGPQLSKVPVYGKMMP